MAITVTDYATVAEVGAYLPDVDQTANSAILTLLSHSASRFIDHTLGQGFYTELTGIKYFNMTSPSGEMQGTSQVNTMYPFYSLTSIQLAYFENQPLSAWLTLNGDGVTPPSNFYLWPPNPHTYSSVGASYYKPYWGFDLAHIPSPNTIFLPIGIGGYKTVAINASWGWPAVPDVIKDITCKLVVRAWRAREAGEVIGSPEMGGNISTSRHFDEKDVELVMSSDLLAIAI